MRTFLSTIVCIAIFCIQSECIAQPAFQYLDDSIMTNLVIKQAVGGTWSNLLRGGEIRISRSQMPTLDLIQSGTGQGAWPPGQGALTFNTLTGFGLNARLNVVGDIIASGMVSAATNVLNVTNVFSTTNSFYYPTNTAALAVNLGTTYGDLQVDGTASVAFTIDPVSVVADVYQTAVVLVRNTSGVATNITAAGMKIQGTPWVTNRTVCTFFHHNLTGDTFTNMTVLPLW